MSDALRDPLEPLFAPWEEPDKHRVRPASEGDSPIKFGRRPTKCLLVPYLRGFVRDWRHGGYAGATETTKALLRHWFDTDHENGFRYHFCQREAVETAIYLYEVVRFRRPTELYSSVLPEDHRDFNALTALPETEDSWARYCAKMATGSGKTKVMSLLIAWSFFNAKYEAEIDLPKHFVLIAPNLIVFDRLCSDFDGEWVFGRDPVLPPEFANDFNVQVVKQDDPGGSSYEGTIYLTNIHRLYEKEENGASAASKGSLLGPEVQKGKVYKLGEALRARISEHPGVMVLNDEAHHLHDPESAWNEAIQAIHRQNVSKGNRGVQLQMDFTATPKKTNGDLFHHIICDFPLGEAVDAGIVKVPVIGRSKDIKKDEAGGDAFEEYRSHLLLGYQQYESAYEEWRESHKPILFVMCENATKANEIAKRLNEDKEKFPLLHGRVLNLHTRLEGKVVKRKIGKQEFQEFVPSEKKISDDDLRWLREQSAELDKPDSHYRCVVSVLMLREGWDVRNVTTIVPLRQYSAKSNILAEQTLGRGLRRMTPSGLECRSERVTVVEHPNFTAFYQEELALEGLDVIIEDLGKTKAQTASIFVDFKNKPVEDLELEIPLVSDAIETTARLEELTFEAIEKRFREHLKPLPIKSRSSGTIQLIERTMITDEVVKVYEIDRGLLALGATAPSVYVRALEKGCRVHGANAILQPLITRFIEELLFEKKVSLFSGEVDHRMSDQDVRETIEFVFAPLVREKTHTESKRVRKSAGTRLSTWKPFQASYTPSRPCEKAAKTMFNLVPCANGFEAEFASFLDDCGDVIAFAKNAGPQKLTIDYMRAVGRRALYWPDFIARMENGNYALIETKGQIDADSAMKAQAAIEWCKSASASGATWSYVFIVQSVFDHNIELKLSSLARASMPRLKTLLESLKSTQAELPLEATPDEIREDKAAAFLKEFGITGISNRLLVDVTMAINQFEYDCRMNHPHFGAAFGTLWIPFEELCGELQVRLLKPKVPSSTDQQAAYFNPYVDDLNGSDKTILQRQQRNLRKNVMDLAFNNRAGVFLHCIDYAIGSRWTRINAPGVWVDVRSLFSSDDLRAIFPRLSTLAEFRNKHVGHGEERLTDVNLARSKLGEWISTLGDLIRLE